ncbi:MAG: TRAM domain-containing protein [Methanothrix sp.]|uniref:Ribosomal RNA large subunit methyltransferase E n=1 Tax=Methanothrix thermoacetophila (strain DSM 6194 / JCM 14653 / NBRC 101360 / PT) TaxID=349307 RepID=RLME_METTP|nr:MULTISPECIES: 23S rRNA (uridine(2552)-2'-O)-methyltransferase [Methanothrix]A0B8A1.1 RecName: Full=Ribosomal RNA large subunit methyltransferase E; AltName: Full=23S rRNA Um2552 methyltransferase; AltName: Full=rRNA (uridine-2'-O-)-methyltransferase [Methanothrix thermoacetophila PT]ABK14925.1 23S rRNA Um-2552 2'-O-methyltransferase [Methanothrix thermoacetophila PT]MBC7078923.1 TRAM domain-containing protein [Methanothrix sp.]NPU87084.1 TRAM domain-containing protein [Methanothrix sp.]
MARDQKDHYYRKAKEEGYRARSAYKLKQINDKFHIIRRGSRVVDLGAAPGGWLQVARELSGGIVVGVDLERIEPLEGIVTIQGDITKEETLEQIAAALGGQADVVISDAAPNLSGIWDVDHARSIDLSRAALRIAKRLLRPGGSFLVKVFQGDMFNDYLEEVKREFSSVHAYTPPASRKESAEIYVIGKKLLSAPVRSGEIYDVTVDSVGRTGDGIAMIQGFAVIVKNASPGERLRIKIGPVKQRFAFASILERL